MKLKMKRFHSISGERKDNFHNTSHKIKIEENTVNNSQIFRITKIERPTIQLSNTCLPIAETSAGSAQSPPKKELDLVCTEEQLSKMTQKQQYACFQSQAYEIKQLRRKLRKFSMKRGKLFESEIIQAQETLKEFPAEIEDQKFLIENLLRAIRIGVLRPETLVFDRLCTIIRNTLNLKIERKGRKIIKIGNQKEIIITEREFKEYLQLPKNENVLNVLIGQNPEKSETEFDKFLQIHADLLKKMSFAQFLATNVKKNN